MKYDLSMFEDMVKHGYLRKTENEDLVLYGYTDKCTFERAWQTIYTRDARGLIFEKKTGRLVAKPFPKFFNMGEMEETQFLNLPKEPYEVWEKCDGSLGIIYNYGGYWRMATRGSLNSEQAVMGKSMMGHYAINAAVPLYWTLLVEIIYPANKIIVDYKNEEKLVLLGAYNRDTGKEFQSDVVEDIARRTGIPMAKKYKYTIEEMIELQKTLPKDQEGFVVRFESGLRIKIKGDEYCKLAKMLAHMSYLSFWEAMKRGRVDENYIVQLPEEFRPEYEPMVEKLESQYSIVMQEVCEDLKKLPQTDFQTKEGKKTVGLFLQEKTHGLKHPKAMFPVINHNADALEEYIMKKIRPDSNEPKEI